jgi:hypothetical protein
MNARTTLPRRNRTRAVERPCDARRNAAQLWLESGRRERGAAKNLENHHLWVCNPLKSHKTAKAFFGRKQAEIWKSLEKG